MPIPVIKFAEAQFSPSPSLVLAPESTLRLLPSRALSFAPAACSVSVLVVSRNGGMKKEIDYRSAFRHGGYRAVAVMPSTILAVEPRWVFVHFVMAIKYDRRLNPAT